MFEKDTYKVLIADDHQMMIDSYASIISEMREFKVVGAVKNGKKVETFFETKDADLILLDLNMPQMNGAQTIEFLKQKRPKLKILVVSMITSPLLVKQVINQGVDGFLFKTSAANEIVKAMRSILQGGHYFDDGINTNNKAKSISEFNIKGNTVALTSRELQVIKLISKGLSTDQIADTLFISPMTVHTHRKNIYLKLDTHNTAELISFSIRHNIISSL
jgi:DNA-binding NarL/FixJ family response regulator